MKNSWGLIVDTTIVGAQISLVKLDEENNSNIMHVSSCLDNQSSAAKLSVNVEKTLEIYDLSR